MIKSVVSPLCDRVSTEIAERIKTETLFIVTRDEVLQRQEDLLERAELETLAHNLEQLGKKVVPVCISDVASLKEGSTVLLLNLDYSIPAAFDLFKRHSAGELLCFPNPFFQKACQHWTGLSETTVPDRHRDRFLQIIGSHSDKDEGIRRTMAEVENILCRNGIASDILHVDIGETVPVFRHSLHSWQQLYRRIGRYDRPPIRIRQVPLTINNSLITSDTGPRLHVFRFMCIT